VGVALSRAQLVVALRQFWPRSALHSWALAFLQKLETYPAAAAKWVSRFRRVWSVRWKRLPARADLTDETLRRRARACVVVFFFGGSQIWGPIWPLSLGLRLMWYLYLGHKSGGHMRLHVRRALSAPRCAFSCSGRSGSGTWR
jgi:hypothetical protein